MSGYLVQTAGKKWHIYVYKDGTMFKCIGSRLESSNPGVFDISGAAIVQVTAGETLDFRVLRENTGSATLYNDDKYNYISIEPI